MFTPHLCVVDHVSASDPAVSEGGMFSVLWELPLRIGDKEKEEKVTGAGDMAVPTTDWRQREGGGRCSSSCDGPGQSLRGGDGGTRHG